MQLQSNLNGANAQALVGADDASATIGTEGELPDDFYVLLLGVDSDEAREKAQGASGTADVSNGNGFRSDTIIVAHVSTSQKKVALCSLERDIKVDIPGNGTQKLNAAYALGGVPMARSEAEELTGESIPYYAVVDMDGLTDIIDSVGGIDVDVEKKFYDNQLGAGIKSSGMQTLDGDSALVYARSRHAWSDGDFARARHQRQVITALAHKVLSSDPGTMYSALESVCSHTATNISLMQLADLASKMSGLDTDTDVMSMMTPTSSADLNGQSFQVLDDSQWSIVKDSLQDFTDPEEALERASANTVSADTSISATSSASTSSKASGSSTGSVSNRASSTKSSSR